MNSNCKLVQALEREVYSFYENIFRSKAGRPATTRKLSDRKAYNRQKNAAITGATDIFVGLEDGQEELLAAANGVVNPARALSSPFWIQIDQFFRNISDADIGYLKQQGISESTMPTPATLHLNSHSASTNPRGYGLFGHKNEQEPFKETKIDELFPEQLIQEANVKKTIPLVQRLLAALLPEEVSDSESEELKIDPDGTDCELDAEFESNLDHLVNFQSGHTAFNGYMNGARCNYDEPQINLSRFPSSGGVNSSFVQCVDGDFANQTSLPQMVACSKFQYGNMQMDEKIALEMQSIGLFPETVSDVARIENDEIGDELSNLHDMYLEQVAKKKGLTNRLFMCGLETKQLQEKEFEQHALDKLVEMAYEKYMTSWGPGTAGRTSNSKMANKQAALAFVKRTLDRYHKFEETGMSCFNEPLFKDIFLSGLQSVETPINGEFAKPLPSNPSFEGRFAASMGSQQPSPVSSSQLAQNDDTCAVNFSDMLQSNSKEETWPNKVKKREVSLEDLGANITGPSGIGTSLTSNTKGKRSERDRDGINKVGRPTLSNAKGERKSKAKPNKQKTTQPSISINAPVGKISDQIKPTLPSASKHTETNLKTKAKEKDELNLDVFDDPDLCNLTETQDLGSWLNFDDDGLQDHDFMGGLEIPMDDLSDLNMMM
ncbi:hypothetical protein ACFE04_015637 [Oxalis oulophora]